MDMLDALLGASPEATVPQNLGEITELCQLLRNREQAVIAAEEALKREKEKLRKISEDILPDALRELGLSEITLDDGTKVTVEDFYQAHISEANRNAALQWLRSHGHEGLIKNDVTVSFGKGMSNNAREFLSFISRWNGEYSKLDRKEGVHPQSLKAFVKQQLTDEETMSEFPQKLFGVFEGRRAKLKAPKTRKA